MKTITLIIAGLIITFASLAHAVVYSGAMDSRSGQQHIPGFTAQSKTFKAGGNPGEGLRLEWQVDNATTPGAWTYTYRLIRGTSKNKGFAFFDIEVASDFTAANILSRQVLWATDGNDNTIPSGLASVTISDPVNFNAIHDFSNATVTEGNFSLVALSKNDLSHYSGDPARVAPGVPGGEASDTTSVGPVAHPFYGIRVTFPGTHLNLAYEASEWEFRIVSDRAPMWGSFFGWGDQTQVSPYWYANIYNNNIDNPVRPTLPPANNLYGADPYKGWILVPGPQVTAQPSRLSVDLATYYRSSGGDGYTNLFATALPSAVLTVSGSGIATPVVMTPDTPNPVVFGRFSAQIPFTQLPSTIEISNSKDPVTVPPHTFSLADEVTISEATYNPINRIIRIKATSSDGLLPLPTLTVPDFAGLNTLDSSGTLVKTLTANPPESITVVSSRGGFSTFPVRVLSGPAPPVATDDASLTTMNIPVIIPVVANDTATAPLTINLDSLAFPVLPANGTVAPHADGTVTYMPNPGFTGSDSFAYTIQDSNGTTSNVASVVVTVSTPAAASSVSAVVAPIATQTVNQPAVITAAGNGGSGAYEYRFYVNDGGTFYLLQPYSTSNICTWVPGKAGVYDLFIEVRSAGSTVLRDAFTNIFAYEVTSPAATGVTLGSDLVSPQTVSTPITFTANGSGGVGTYEYRYWLNSGSGYSVVRPYSTVNSWVFTPQATGIYDIFVEVRIVGSQALRDAYNAILSFRIN